MISPARVFAIATLLDPATDRVIHELWQHLENECELRGIRLTPTPHFSWMGAQGFENPLVPEMLRRFASETTPFRVRTAGLGLFTGPQPVLYLPIVKDRKLLEFHQRLWEAAAPASTQPNPYYSPERWIPHITLAYRDITPEKIGCAFRHLLVQTIELEIQVDHLVLLYSIDQEVGLISRDDFNKEVRDERSDS